MHRTIKVKVIDTSMRIYAMDKSTTFMPSLNAIAQILSKIWVFWYKLNIRQVLEEVVTLQSDSEKII